MAKQKENEIECKNRFRHYSEKFKNVCIGKDSTSAIKRYYPNCSCNHDFIVIDISWSCIKFNNTEKME